MVQIKEGVYRALAACCLITATGMSHATPITINGSLFGSNFDVTYDDTLLGLYGTPQLINNELTFSPTTFTAVSVQGMPPNASTSSSITLEFAVHEGFVFDSLNILERGDALLRGDASVDLIADISATALLFSPPTNTNGFSDWEATASLSDLDSVFTLTLNNSLFASSNDADGIDVAFIEKKFVSFIPDVNRIPEPGTLALLVLGLASIAIAQRKK